MSGQDNGSARCFVIADANSGMDASALAAMIAESMASGVVEVLVIDAATGRHKNCARPMSDIVERMSILRGDGLKGYLAPADGKKYGLIGCDRRIEAATFRALSLAYDLILFATGTAGFAMAPDMLGGVPALMIANADANGSLADTGRLIDLMLEDGAMPRPEGFVMRGADNAVAARLANRWRLAFWGQADRAANIAGRIIERAAPVHPRAAEYQNGDDGRCEGASCEPDPPPSDEFESVASELIDSIRRDPQFKNLNVPTGDREASERLKKSVASAARRLLSRVDQARIGTADRETLVKRVIDDSVGFGPIEALLADPEVTEIMINGAGSVYAERGGMISRAASRFADGSHLMTVIERMVATAGRRIDESTPMVDARLPDGSRLNVIIPPVAIDGPAVTIRRFSKRIRDASDAVSNGFLTRAAADFLAACVRSRISIVISGGTGAGKTTLLNILSSAIDPSERIVTIEDAAELSLNLPHVVRLESRPASIDGGGRITIRDLVKNALRMRPDRIVVGECRGAEALDMLQAMNTGHEGSLTTVHANSPRDALARMETMVLMAGMELPAISIREQIARAVNIVVQVSRMSGGARRVVEISEILEMEGQAICLRTLASLASSDGKLTGTGAVPRFAERLRSRGIALPQL